MEKTPHHIDQRVGGRVRQRRMFVGMSQEQLGERLGLTFQQIQKYEKGTNRISASRLWEMSKILDVPISFFFEGVEGDSTASAEQGFSEAGQAEFDPGTDSERLRLNRYFVRIKDSGLRRAVIDLTKSMAEPDAGRDNNP